MIKHFLISFVLLLLGNSLLVAQKSDWTEPPYDALTGKVSKTEGNIRYTMDSIMTIEDRNKAINTVKQYINENLLLLDETDFNDSVHIVLTKDRDEMYKYIYERFQGYYMPKNYDVTGIPENMIFCIYGIPHDALKHELMHMLSRSKWGNMETNNGWSTWLDEGLAVFANPESLNCDGRTLEERYTYFLQNNELLELDSLFSSSNIIYNNKRSYTQAGYIVSYLVDNFGIKKLKTLWQSGMNDFEKIYGIRFEDIILQMHDKLKLKYPMPISIDKVYLYKNCVE